MSISAVDSKVNYTLNGNQYKSSNTGKVVGAALGGTVAGVGTAIALKNGSLMRMANSAVTKLSTGSGKIAQTITKYPKFFKYGVAGTAVGLALALYTGIGKLIGHGVDRLVENKRAKETDAQANNVEYLA
jgi:hypothetical protein